METGQVHFEKEGKAMDKASLSAAAITLNGSQFGLQIIHLGLQKFTLKGVSFSF